MQYECYTYYSNILQRHMTCGIYGHSGKLVFAFAAQGKKHNDYADNDMIAWLSPWIDAGWITVVTPDSLDEESWAAQHGDMGWRAWMQELWFRFITDELLPAIREKRNNYDMIMTTGCSMGGTHAVNMFLRRPDLVDVCIGQSCCYDSDLFFGDYMDENLYNNTPVAYMANMPNDHYYIDMYNHRTLIISIGQGDWEWPVAPSNYKLVDILRSKGINVWFDVWGYDSYHDWPWWRKQIVYFMEQVLGRP